MHTKDLHITVCIVFHFISLLDLFLIEFNLSAGFKLVVVKKMLANPIQASCVLSK